MIRKYLLVGAVLLLLLNLLFSQDKRNSGRPNIIFIMSDDHAYQAISVYDNKLIETPNIDRIAKMGMLFTQASVTNSICAPSRATILTGKHSHLKYHDNADLSQGYVDKFLEDASNGKVFGVSKEKVGEIKSRRTKNAAKD